MYIEATNFKNCISKKPNVALSKYIHLILSFKFIYHNVILESNLNKCITKCNGWFSLKNVENGTLDYQFFFLFFFKCKYRLGETSLHFKNYSLIFSYFSFLIIHFWIKKYNFTKTEHFHMSLYFINKAFICGWWISWWIMIRIQYFN